MTSFDHARAALAAFDAGAPARTAAWAAVAHRDDVALCEAADDAALALLQDAYYEDTKSLHSRDSCRRISVDDIRRVVGQPRLAPGARVLTPHGPGVVDNSEICRASNREARMVSTGRYGVRLDHCQLRAVKDGVAYFWPSELQRDTDRDETTIRPAPMTRHHDSSIDAIKEKPMTTVDTTRAAMAAFEEAGAGHGACRDRAQCDTNVASCESPDSAARLLGDACIDDTQAHARRDESLASPYADIRDAVRCPEGLRLQNLRVAA